MNKSRRVNRRRRVTFQIGDNGTSLAADLGGKGAALKEMHTAGVPVPAAFTITTAVARAIIQNRRIPARLEGQIRWQVARLEQLTGKGFGDPANPLLLSVRSGAPVSMPGMMNTVLNVGLNATVVAGMSLQHGQWFAVDCYRRFLEMFGETVLDIDPAKFDAIWSSYKTDAKHRSINAEKMKRVCQDFQALIRQETGSPVPEDPWDQILLATRAVLQSWDCPRAKAYREAMQISHTMGTAVTVQEMVFGNLPGLSCTGVVFSRNCATGEPGMWGEFLLNAQGEDVVAGKRTPQPIQKLRGVAPALYEELDEAVQRLELNRGTVVDVEFTVQAGKLYILQVRAAKLTPEAALTTAVHFVWEKKWDKDKALATISQAQIRCALEGAFDDAAMQAAVVDNQLLAQGLSASPGAAVGRLVTTVEVALESAKQGEKVVLLRDDTRPDDLPGMLPATTVAIVTKEGGTTCHAAVVARGLGKPCVVGIGQDANLEQDVIVSVDGRTGRIFRGGLPLTGSINKKEVNIFLRWVGIARNLPWPEPRLDFSTVESKGYADQLAGDFYLTDAMARAAEGTALGVAAARLKLAIHTAVAERIAMYLTVAVAGEARHVQCNTVNPRPPLLQELEKTYSLKIGGDRGVAQRAVLNVLRGLGKAEQIRFLVLAATHFAQHGWWRTSYGGKPWAEIAHAAHGFLSGQLGHSVFTDLAFDLQHNTGCVFGKHPVGERGSNLQQVLDMKKRAEGIAALAAGLTRYRIKLSPPVQQLHALGQREGIW